MTHKTERERQETHDRLQKAQEEEIAKVTKALKQEIEKRDAQSRLLHQQNMDLSTKLDEAHKQLQVADVRIQPQYQASPGEPTAPGKGQVAAGSIEVACRHALPVLEAESPQIQASAVGVRTCSIGPPKRRESHHRLSHHQLGFQMAAPPQQLLSRIAERGHTILYPAMTITPKHSLYPNDQTALDDIRLNQLGNAVYQVWLHSDGPVNIYTDTLSESDITNIELGIKSLIAKTDATSVLLLVQFPGWWPVAKRLKENGASMLCSTAWIIMPAFQQIPQTH